jgi:hypothetical protein
MTGPINAETETSGQTKGEKTEVKTVEKEEKAIAKRETKEQSTREREVAQREEGEEEEGF